MKRVRGWHPQWLSTGKAVIEPTAAAKDVGVRDALLCFGEAAYHGLVDAFALQERPDSPSMPGALKGKLGDHTVIYEAYFGGPAAGMLTEALIASGVSRIFMLGTAGSISPICRIGDVVVPSWGIREEGTSYHYLAPGVPCRASESARAQVRSCLVGAGIDFKEGGVWTTDAPYRETRDKVLAYAKRGALAVEMECATLMAIAAYRMQEFAALLIITDELFGDQWVPGFHAAQVLETGVRVCRALAECLGQGGE